MPHNLASSPDYLITHHEAPDGRGGPLVVTLGGQPSKRTAAGFGTGFAKANGWDTVYVAQREGTQYQGLPLEVFAAALAPVSEGRDVVCYGSSLGAYAALYYGGTLDARIIAAAPMLPAWPPLERPAHDRLPIAHGTVADGPISTKAPVVIYDPYVRHDQMMIDGIVLPAYPEARFLRLPLSGHTVLNYLKQAGLLKTIIRDLIADDALADHTYPTEDNATWCFNRGRAIRKSDPDEAIRLLTKGFGLERSRHIYGNLMPLLLRAGRIDEARDLLTIAQADPPLTLPPGTQAQVDALDLRPHAPDSRPSATPASADRAARRRRKGRRSTRD